MNYFYCSECKFEYFDTENRGFFGEPIVRTVMEEQIYRCARVDYLQHCPMCNASTCGVVKIENKELGLKSGIKAKLRAVIKYNADKV